MTKIAYIPESFPQPSETFVINEIHSLLDLGYQIVVIPRAPGYSGEIKHANFNKILNHIKIITNGARLDLNAFLQGLFYGRPIWGGLRPKALINHFKGAINIARHTARIKAEKPELIIIHFGYDNAVAGALAASSLNIPSILWMHGSDMHTVPHRSLSWIAKQVSVVMTNSQYSAGLLANLGVKNRVLISTLGVDIEKFKPLASTKKKKNPTIICIARLGHNKNHERLLHVFKRVLAQAGNAELWLVGDGPFRSKYENLANRLNVSNQVIFWGVLPQERVVELMRQSWIKVLLSEKEALGVAFIEAQAAGLPCVATSVGGIPEVIAEGTTGFLFDLNSNDFESQVADAILKLINDEGLRTQMGREARARAVRLFDEKLHIGRMETVIQKLLRNKG